MDLTLDYGRTGLPVTLPDANLRQVVTLQPATPLPDQSGAVREALRAPRGGQPLGELARGRQNACIVICDVTRPVPNQVLLPEIIAELEAAGIPSDQITILIATGNHRPNEGDELVEMIGADIAARYRVVNHRSYVEDEQSWLGKSRQGVDIFVNKLYVEADLKIITGLIEPHFMAGYSGGRKIVCPGLTSLETVHYFHSPALLEDHRATNGVLDGNPLHEFALEVCERVGVDFSVNVVIDAERRICGIFAGALLPAHDAGVAFCNEICQVEIEQPVPIVVTSSAGYPLDATFYQAVKGMVGALPALSEGGTVIIAAELSEGLGGPEFSEMLRAAGDHESFMQRILSPEHVLVKDQWEIEMLCRVLRRGQVTVVSDRVPAEILEECLVAAAPTVEEAVQRALAQHGSDAGIIAIPNGPYCIPVARHGASAG